MKTQGKNSRSVNEGWFDSLLRRPVGESKFLHEIHRQLVREGAGANLLLSAVDSGYQPRSTVQLLDRIALLLRDFSGVGQNVLDHLAKMRGKAESYDKMRLDDRDRSYAKLSRDFRYILEQDPYMSVFLNRPSGQPETLNMKKIRWEFQRISKTFQRNKYSSNVGALKHILSAVKPFGHTRRKESAIITACEGLLGIIEKYKNNPTPIAEWDDRAYQRLISVLEKEIGSEQW